jgi:hypothetical protein
MLPLFITGTISVLASDSGCGLDTGEDLRGSGGRRDESEIRTNSARIT